MNEQLEQLRRLLNEKNAAGVLLESKAMKRYLGTLTGGGCAILITPNSEHLLFDGRYLVEAETKEKVLQLHCIERGKKALYQNVQTMVGNQKLLVESTISYEAFLLMEEVGLDVELVGSELLNIRAIKSKDGLTRIEHAVDITDQIFEKIIDHIQPGMSERELCAYVYYECFAHGADAMSFEPIIISGERTALPHGRASDRIISSGEPIMIDFGVEINGYQSDMTRMVAINSVPDKIEKIYNIVLEAQLAAIHAIKVGIPASEVDKASRDVIEDAGYGEYYVHGLGHGIGVDNSDEHPIMNGASSDILAENMVLTCEPGIYVPGLGGVRIEDIVKVSKTKGVSLTNTPKNKIRIVER